MNKEQLIEQLNNLKSHLPQGELDSVRISTEDEIRELEAKLADNNNYISNKANFFIAGRKSNLQRAIASAERKVLMAEHEIAELENNISLSNEELAKVSSDIELVESQLEVAGRELRSSGGNEELTERLSSLYAQRDEYRNYEAELRGNIVEYERTIESRRNIVAEQQGVEQRYQTLLGNLNARVEAAGPNVDVIAKLKDENTLNDLRNTLNSLEARYEYSNMDLSSELDDIINEVSNDSMSLEEAIGHLADYKNHSMSEETLANLDSIKASERASLEQVKANIDMEITNLESKLSNEDNYILSGFVTELNEDRIAKASQNRIKTQEVVDSLDEEINKYNNDIIRIDNEIEYHQENIKTLKVEIAKWQVQLEKLMPGRDDNLINNLNNRIIINDEEIKYQELSINDLITEKELVSNIKQGPESRKQIQVERLTRYDSLIEKLKINNEKTVDSYRKMLDENRLASLKSSKTAVDSRLSFLDYDLSLELDSIINSNVEEEVVSDTQPEPMPESTPAPASTSDDVLISTPTLNNKEEATPEVIDFDPQKNALVPMGIAAWEDANPELKKQVKKKKLLERAKDFFKGIFNDIKNNWPKYLAAGLLGAAILSTIKGCGPINNENNLTNDGENTNIEQDNNQNDNGDKNDIESAVDDAISSSESEDNELPTPAPTSTPDETVTPDPTPTPTPDETVTPTPTPTPDQTSTPNPTPTPTPTPDETVIPTPTPTPNPDPTPAPGTGGEVIDVEEEIIDETVTPDPTPDPTPDQTPAPTPTPGEDVTITGGDIIDETEEVVNETNPTPTPTPTPDPTPAPDPNPTPTPTPDPTPAPTPDQTPVPTPTPDPTPGDETDVTITGGEVIDVEEEIVDNDVVLPDSNSNQSQLPSEGEIRNDGQEENNDQAGYTVNLEDNEVSPDDLDSILAELGLNQNDLSQGSNSLGGM